MLRNKNSTSVSISVTVYLILYSVLGYTEPVSGMHIFVLSGQSNMAGRGGVANFHWDGIIPPECHSDDRRIFRLNPDMQWEVAREPLHLGIESPNKTCGVGPGMSFANYVKRRVGTVGLVPCAFGGTEIKEWVPGTFRYQNMLDRTLSASAAGEVKALLWFQGESDTKSNEQVHSYRKKLEKVINSFRTDLKLPSLPVIQVAIATGYNVEYKEQIRMIQKKVNLSNVVTVDAKGLPLLKGDPLHLSTRAQVRLGRRMAKAYLTHFMG